MSQGWQPERPKKVKHTTKFDLSASNAMSEARDAPFGKNDISPPTAAYPSMETRPCGNRVAWSSLQRDACNARQNAGERPPKLFSIQALPAAQADKRPHKAPCHKTARHGNAGGSGGFCLFPRVLCRCTQAGNHRKCGPQTRSPWRIKHGVDGAVSSACSQKPLPPASCPSIHWQRPSQIGGWLP